MTTQPSEGWFDPDATTFGDRLSGAREAAGMSQAQLAKRLGVKIKTMKAWEEDLSEPRANRLSHLSGMLNVSLRWLLTGEGPGPEGLDVGDLSPDVIQLLGEVRELKDQMVAASERLGRLERELRATLKVEAGE